MEFFPFIELTIIFADNLFPLPGFPINIIGIFVINETNIENIFSFNDVVLTIPLSKSICSIKKSCSILIKSLKRKIFSALN